MLHRKSQDVDSDRWQCILHIDSFVLSFFFYKEKERERKQVFNLQRFEPVRLPIILFPRYTLSFIYFSPLYFSSMILGRVKSNHLNYHSWCARRLYNIMLICFVTVESENDAFERAKLLSIRLSPSLSNTFFISYRSSKKKRATRSKSYSALSELDYVSRNSHTSRLPIYSFIIVIIHNFSSVPHAFWNSAAAAAASRAIISSLFRQKKTWVWNHKATLLMNISKLKWTINYFVVVVFFFRRGILWMSSWSLLSRTFSLARSLTTINYTRIRHNDKNKNGLLRRAHRVL